MPRSRCKTVPLLLVTLLSGGVSRSDEVSDEVSGEAPRRLDVPRRADGREGTLDWVIGKVSSSSDRFASERVSETLNGRLTELSKWLVEPGEKPSSSFLAAGFRAARAVPGKLETLVEKVGTKVVSDPVRSTSRVVGREGWSTDIGSLRSLCGVVAKAKFKVFRFEQATAGQGETKTRVLLEIDGRTADGAHAQVRTVWDLGWTRNDDRWVIASLDRVSFELSRLTRRVFTDVSKEAFGSNRSFRELLSRGVSYWRTRIDSASGIDVYGHQGITVGDYDGDGLDDVYVPQPAGLPNRLFRNRGDGTFHDVTERMGLDVLDNTGGVLLVDFDNDGDRDLLAVTALEVLLFENIGKRGFRRLKRSGLESAKLRSASTLGCSAADYDLDGDLDLYVFSYVFWAGSASKLQSSYPYPYHDANNGAPNFLFRNEGELRFRDVTHSVGLDVNNRRFSLASSWTDYDDDGDPDLYVANDFGKNNLYRNDRGKFVDVAADLGVDDVGNGMSVTWEDYDNDGRIDLYVGNMWSSAGSRIAGQPEFKAERLRSTYLRMSRGNSLFRNLGGGRFEDVSVGSRAFFARWSWSGQFLDVEGDGIEDLYVVNGFISGENRDDL